MLKEVEMLDFHFNVSADEMITFEISYIGNPTQQYPGNARS
jgi:hypothetical protein